MPATTGIMAGVESNVVTLSYGAESTFGVAPATTFQGIRFNNEALRGQKQRQRPNEITGDGQASEPVTTQESASGRISCALSYGTFDDLLSCVLRNDWQAKTVVQGAAGDITITSGTNTLSSTTSGKFANVVLGSWIKVSGFTNAANNVFGRVLTKPNNQTLTLGGVTGLVTETPAGTAAKVAFSNLSLALLPKTLFFQKRFSASMWRRYPGAFLNTFAFNANLGQFLGLDFDLFAQQETHNTTDASTGGILPAPTGGVHDPVGGIKGLWIGDALTTAVLTKVSMTLNNEGAKAAYGLGSPASQGLDNTGTATGTGSLSAYFKDATLYTLFKAETAQSFAFRTADPAGNSYILTFPRVRFMDPQETAGGAGQSVMSEYAVECSKDPVSGTTMMIDRFDYTS